jgi:hypothetical protein
MIQTTKERFFATVGKMNVHPRIINSKYPYTSDWMTPSGSLEGRTVDTVLNGKQETAYFVEERHA